MRMREVTIELTNYCPNECPYCSSNAGPEGSDYLSVETITGFLKDDEYDRINISGGEPLSHPQFYNILQLCKKRVVKRTGFVAVYTNEFDCIMFNANVKSGVRVEANVPLLPNTDIVHVLKMIRQGYEAKRPDVHYSCNWDKECAICAHTVLKPNGEVGNTPCTKNK